MAIALLLLVAGAPGDHQKKSTNRSVSASLQRLAKEPVRILRIPSRPVVMSPRPIEVELHVTVRSTSEELWCPGIEIEWGDGELSAVTPDCDPFEQASDEDKLEQRYGPFSHLYRVKGQHTILVNVMKNGKRIRQVTNKLDYR